MVADVRLSLILIQRARSGLELVRVEMHSVRWGGMIIRVGIWGLVEYEEELGREFFGSNELYCVEWMIYKINYSASSSSR